jgi:hypothetical protein
MAISLIQKTGFLGAVNPKFSETGWKTIKVCHGTRAAKNAIPESDGYSHKPG